MPIVAREVTSDVPPKLMKGRGKPTTGKMPSVMASLPQPFGDADGDAHVHEEPHSSPPYDT